MDENNGKIELEEGTYEIIRHRLDKQGKELREKLEKLNNERRRVFGSADAQLISTERIITDNACIPADMISISDKFIFGYNVSIKLANTSLNDVFSQYSYAEQSIKKTEPDLLSDPNFISDFNEMYKYFSDTHFVKFSHIGINLYMVFKTGKGVSDIKVFKWQILDDKLQYIDNRSTHEFRFPLQYEFKWTKATRDMFVEGKHPHINIENTLFVETTEGDLTIKAENNTDTGSGVYSEPVENADQTLDDAEFYYSKLNDIMILKIRPYQEPDFRYIVYSAKTREAVRIDAISKACVFLPEGQGIIFSNGYYLQSGDYKFFDTGSENLIYESKIASPNGEDYIYSFYDELSGLYVLLKYNIIEQQLETPISCHGFTIFNNGEMVNFRSDGESKKHHVVQIWQTTFFHADYNTVVDTSSYLFKIGNKALVKGIADSKEILTLLQKDDTYTNLYLELVKKTTDILDSYFWINNPNTFELNTSLISIKESAVSAIDEFEKVSKLKKNTSLETQKISSIADKLFEDIKRKKLDNIDNFVFLLTEIRKLRGDLISLKQLRYVKTTLVEEYENKAEELSGVLSEKCVELLVSENSLAPYQKRVDEIGKKVDDFTKVIEADAISEEILKVSSELEMLIEIVSNLKIKDTVKTAQIIDNISSVYSQFNKIKSDLKRKRNDIFLVEGKIEFASQIKLISQAVINYLDLCDTPEKTNEYLTKLLVQLEELEGKFTEFDDFINEISIKREEIQNAFEQRKIQLIEKRSKRADTLLQSATRILKAVDSRISKLSTESEINGYFASDMMVDKVRDIVKELVDLDDSVKADEIQSRLKTVKEDTIRQLKDKTELFVEGSNIIKLGTHSFSVNTQSLGLTMVNRSDTMYYHLSGTGFFEKVENDDFYKYKPYWNQTIVSENDTVYRSEYLAYKILTSKFEHIDPKAKKVSTEELEDLVRQFMATRYSEGYVKGVHDIDASKILAALLQMRSHAELLRYSSKSRACAEYFYNIYLDDDSKAEIEKLLSGFAYIMQVFPNTLEYKKVLERLKTELKTFVKNTQLFDLQQINSAAEYLFFELIEGDTFVINQYAVNLHKEFFEYLKNNQSTKEFEQSCKSLAYKPSLKYGLIKNWLQSFISETNNGELSKFIDETAITIYNKSLSKKRLVEVELKQSLEDMEGSHNLIEDRTYELDYIDFMLKLHNFETVDVPAYNDYLHLKKQLTEDFETDMRLNEFKPRVMSSFVRNQLINNVYLPLIGSNLAKQIGTAGENKRTDLMGMLLLISPPGYGKTTLMEYIANRLGIIFMKINGPALGHSIISVDPSEATNATAREELEKLNLAFEIGDNVMIYLDDIQHCNPELLQKFISMADGQRKIEGVYKGRPKTYDFRGKKVCVIMAGNPYTESGDKFQIPDMLANRADIYNLGDILGDSKNEFLLSYIENSLTSNAILSKLASKSRKDVYSLIESVESGGTEPVEYEANHTAEELNEYKSVLRMILHIRNTLWLVNKEYIYSAGKSDAYRTEPPFKLQGSYRDMNKMAEKVIPIMNDTELATLILSHYENESQTLTSDAEANLLKFKQITNQLTHDEAERRKSILATYIENKQTSSNQQIAVIASEIGDIANSLSGIKDKL